MKSYVALKLFTRYGKYFSVLVALLVFGCGLFAFYEGQIGALWLGVCFVASLLGAFLTLLLADLTQLISEMLIPH